MDSRGLAMMKRLRWKKSNLYVVEGWLTCLTINTCQFKFQNINRYQTNWGVRIALSDSMCIIRVTKSVSCSVFMLRHPINKSCTRADARQGHSKLEATDVYRCSNLVNPFRKHIQTTAMSIVNNKTFGNSTYCRWSEIKYIDKVSISCYALIHCQIGNITVDLINPTTIRVSKSVRLRKYIACETHCNCDDDLKTDFLL